VQDVQRFFEKRHADAYKIYNLCSERAYDPAKFKKRAARYPFDDHNPPPFAVMVDFCQVLIAALFLFCLLSGFLTNQDRMRWSGCAAIRKTPWPYIAKLARAERAP